MSEPWLHANTLLVTAHPDDETVGLGSRLYQFTNLSIALLTDGAPRTGTDATHAGCGSWQEYAELRKREMTAALARAAVHHDQLHRFDYPDQQTIFHVREITRRLTELIRQIRPKFIFTHPYEGGHPDHDSASLAVHLATRQLETLPAVYEFASYHLVAEHIETERFIGQPMSHPLNADQQHGKHAMIDCYSSQAAVLSMFPVHHEPIRAAPPYDYRELPNNGLLLYERWRWDLTGVEWLHHARQNLS